MRSFYFYHSTSIVAFSRIAYHSQLSITLFGLLPILIPVDCYLQVRGFAQSEGQVLVHQISNKLLVDFQSSTLF